MTFNNEIKEKYLGLLLWFVALILFFSLIYCIIKYPHFGGDGSFSRGLVTLPFWEIIHITAIDVHPPLYYLGLNVFVQLLSMLNIDIIYACELFSTVPYIILLIVSFTKIRKDYGFLTSGFFSFTLIAMSSFFKNYLIVRMYSWAILFVLLTFIYFKDVLENSTYKSWILFSIFSVLCAYTHYYAAMVVFIMYAYLAIHLLINRSKIQIKSEFKKVALSVILMFILYLPWIFVALNQIIGVHESYWVPQIDMDLVLSCFSNWLVITDSFAYEVIAILLVIFFLIYMIREYLFGDDKDDYYVLLGTLVFFGTIVFSIILSLTFKPILLLRYVVPVFSILWLCISIKLGKIKNNKILIAIVVILLLISASNILTQIHGQETSANSFIKENQVYESINNNDSIIIHEQLQRSVRMHYRLNETYQQYANYVLNGKLHSLKYTPSFLDNDTQFNIPEDYFKYNDKNVYIIAGPGHSFKNKTNIQFEELENVRIAPKIYKVTVLNNGEENNESVVTEEDTRDPATIEIITNNISSGEKLNVVVKSDSDLSRRINVTVNNVSHLVSLKGGIASVEFDDLSPGTYKVTATYKGDENYKSTSATTTVIVK